MRRAEQNKNCVDDDNTTTHILRCFPTIDSGSTTDSQSVKADGRPRGSGFLSTGDLLRATNCAGIIIWL